MEENLSYIASVGKSACPDIDGISFDDVEALTPDRFLEDIRQ